MAYPTANTMCQSIVVKKREERDRSTFLNLKISELLLSLLSLYNIYQFHILHLNKEVTYYFQVSYKSLH